MKVALVAHGYPPELVGGTENAVQALARGLVRHGAEVLVIAGSMDHADGFRTSVGADRDPRSGEEFRVMRIHRADLYFDHWQKSASGRVAEAFREILRTERPDVVHVHHWIRLTRDLIACAAIEGIPAVATLHDLWTTCLISFRVRPDTREFCEATLGANPCLDCAAQLPPRTPWVKREALHMAFAERRADLLRELSLARAVVVPTEAHARTVERFLGLREEAFATRVIPHGRDLDWPVPAPERSGPIEDGRLVIGSWGHLHPLKGADLVVEAIRLLDDPTRVTLHLAGGEVDAAFSARVRGLAEGLDVRFHGAFEPDDLPGHPATRVDAFVSGTRAAESWGLVIDEAAALGLPMVLPDAGAYPERLSATGGRGRGALFYRPRDATSLSSSLAALLERPRLLAELGAELRGAQVLAELVPTTDEQARLMAALYAEVVDAGPPEPPALDWWAAKLAMAREEEWDSSLSRRSAEELGLS